MGELVGGLGCGGVLCGFGLGDTAAEKEPQRAKQQSVRQVAVVQYKGRKGVCGLRHRKAILCYGRGCRSQRFLSSRSCEKKERGCKGQRCEFCVKRKSGRRSSHWARVKRGSRAACACVGAYCVRLRISGGLEEAEDLGIAEGERSAIFAAMFDGSIAFPRASTAEFLAKVVDLDGGLGADVKGKTADVAEVGHLGGVGCELCVEFGGDGGLDASIHREGDTGIFFGFFEGFEDLFA